MGGVALRGGGRVAVGNSEELALDARGIRQAAQISRAAMSSRVTE